MNDEHGRMKDVPGRGGVEARRLERNQSCETLQSGSLVPRLIFETGVSDVYSCVRTDGVGIQSGILQSVVILLWNCKRLTESGIRFSLSFAEPTI
jgi:hypothetical protein